MNSIPAVNSPASDAGTSPRPIDVQRERELTAGSRRSHHFNAAGAALPSVGVVSTVVDHLRLEESVGGYEASAEVRARSEAVYDSAARLIGAGRDEIALFDSASTGLRVILDALRPRVGSRIIASRNTYVSHALHLMTLEREEQVVLDIAPVGPGRQIDLDALERLLAEGPPAIVTVAHVPTSSGLVEPVALIGELVRSYGGFYIVDATQSVGHLRTDVREIGCDALVTTGRKFLRAPRGTGFGYLSAAAVERLTPTAPDVRAAQWTAPADWKVDTTARRFETWEAGIAARLGLGAAIDEALDRGLPATEAWLTAAGRAVRAALAEVEGVRVAEPLETPSAIVTFEVDGVSAAEVVAELASQKVRLVSVPATHGQWDLGDRGIPAVVRASIHVYNDENDIAALIDRVSDIARAQRKGQA
ncbi:aminotransferase class V-fold PLP-dependent enzyme [Herbiconiux ginsengi]|uniref:Selenocysteine lyase/Cysteine desulfurase n=1 Tax=Herbiconiux ginsengi TaxID=381665 RepID=A0A1H3SWJ2_9MICO|nr:aminotransferase class V-fold PLP-dependent enzyme [Herbiconiux ginsengi]SDZ42018.1 Selenocysteine lyase/Cysteine desulfurase [Herbiconiux ginsengi]